MRPIHHPQIIFKERLNPNAQPVDFTFDNSNIRSQTNHPDWLRVISGFSPPHNFHKRINQKINFV
jgi:hypothetical protein